MVCTLKKKMNGNARVCVFFLSKDLKLNECHKNKHGRFPNDDYLYIDP